MIDVLGQDQRFGHGGASREDLGEQPVAKGLQHEPVCEREVTVRSSGVAV